MVRQLYIAVVLGAATAAVGLGIVTPFGRHGVDGANSGTAGWSAYVNYSGRGRYGSGGGGLNTVGHYESDLCLMPVPLSLGVLLGSTADGTDCDSTDSDGYGGSDYAR